MDTGLIVYKLRAPELLSSLRSPSVNSAQPLALL